MSQSAAENFALALERVGDRSLSEEEHEVAVEELLKAHVRLMQGQGVELTKRRTAGMFISFFLLLAVVVSMALNITWSREASSAADTANDAANSALRIGRGLHQLQVATVLNQRAGCERANDDRAGEIKNLRSDAAVEHAQLNLWLTALLEASPEEVEALEETKTGKAIQGNIQRLERGIAHKRAAVKHKIEAQAPVAIKPGSVRADCKTAYPLNKPAAVVLRHGAADSARTGPLAPGGLELASAER